jgi:hypothetical protein
MQKECLLMISGKDIPSVMCTWEIWKFEEREICSESEQGGGRRRDGLEGVKQERMYVY